MCTTRESKGSHKSSEISICFYYSTDEVNRTSLIVLELTLDYLRLLFARLLWIIIAIIFSGIDGEEEEAKARDECVHRLFHPALQFHGYQGEPESNIHPAAAGPWVVSSFIPQSAFSLVLEPDFLCNDLFYVNIAGRPESCFNGREEYIFFFYKNAGNLSLMTWCSNRSIIPSFHFSSFQ